MANEQRGGSGNFANDPQRTSEPGKKGSEHGHDGQQSQSGGSKGQQGGSGNVTNDPQRDPGHKGGQR